MTATPRNTQRRGNIYQDIGNVQWVQTSMDSEMTNTGQPLSSSATPVIHNVVGLCLMAVLATSLACESIVASSCGARPLDYWTSLPNDIDRANRIVLMSGDNCGKALTVAAGIAAPITPQINNKSFPGWRTPLPQTYFQP